MTEKRKHQDLESCSDDPVISLQDIIEEDKELETTANAVLGGSDDQECTYPHGYLPRQALYACDTCAATSGSAGVCLACSLECHEGHDLYELYTKRHFRCDCGNAKFPNLVCKLYTKKGHNEENEYNHNFNGSYCTCKRPYPDPDDSIDDEMIQCVICEDWFHGRHLKGEGTPVGSDYAEMICHLCMDSKAQFLWFYNWELVSRENEIVDVLTVTKDEPLQGTDIKSESTPSEHSMKQPIKTEQLHQRQASAAGSADSKVVKMSVKKVPDGKEECKLQSFKTKYKSSDFPESASFWPEGWRQRLCHCDECTKMLKEKGMLFLLDSEDTVAEYEKTGTNKYNGSTMERGMQALGGMNRIQQVEVIQGYNDMKAKLSEYLRTFADEGKVVTEDDIKTFFQRMTQQKRQKVTIPHLCK